MKSIVSFIAGFTAGLAYAANKKKPFRALQQDARKWYKRGRAYVRQSLGLETTRKPSASKRSRSTKRQPVKGVA